MKIACIGYGGHSKVIINIIKKLYSDAKIYIFDDFLKKSEDVTYLGKISDIDNFIGKDYLFVCCIGNIETRKKIISKNLKWLTLIDPSSIISNDVKVGEGSVIMHGTICQPGCVIGKHCIINTKSSIDHDCKISNNSHICPGSTLCGNVVIGENTLVGSGSTIIENVVIGNNNIIGAGSVVLRKEIFSKNNYLAYGVPCKIIRNI